MKAAHVNHASMARLPIALRAKPTREEYVWIGDWCAFKEGRSIFIGRLTAFSFMTGTSLKHQEYNSLSAPTEPPSDTQRQIGCLCSWFTITKRKTLKEVEMDVHGYFSLLNYICTIVRPEMIGEQLVINCSKEDIEKLL